MRLIIVLIALLLLSGCATESGDSYGVLCDIHYEQNDYFDDQIDELASYNIKGVFVCGDSVYNGGEMDDSAEMESVLSKLVTLDVPVYIIPGNHETHRSYSVIDEYDVIDMARIPELNIGEVLLVSLPGYYIKEGFMEEDGYYATQEMIDPIAHIKSETPVLLLTHGPPYCSREQCVDTAYTGENVGSKELRDAMVGIEFAIFGHIHEAGPMAITNNEQIVKENTYSDTLWLNPGASKDGNIALLTFSEGRAKYKSLS